MNTESVLLSLTAERDEARQLVADIVAAAAHDGVVPPAMFHRATAAVVGWSTAPTEPPPAPEDDEPRMAGEFGETVFSSGSVSPLSRAEELEALWPLAPVAGTAKPRGGTL